MPVDKIVLENFNAAYLKVHTNPSIDMELSEHFTYMHPNAKFHPRFKSKVWNGKIGLYNRKTKLIYAGLKDDIVKFCRDRDYDIFAQKEHDIAELTHDKAQEFVKNLNVKLPENSEIYDYQLQAFIDNINQKRTLTLSPTSSGKSAIIYLTQRYLDCKTLILIDRIQLVKQLYKDFESYGFDSENNIHMIFGGEDKDSDKQIVISTWQSIIKQDPEWFEQFECIIADECLHPDTLITMADGSYKKIKDINVGDMVITFDENTKQYVPNKVLKVHKNISKKEKKYKITCKDGTSMIITGNHKVLLETGIWKRVDELKIGDVINSIS